MMENTIVNSTSSPSQSKLAILLPQMKLQNSQGLIPRINQNNLNKFNKNHTIKGRVNSNNNIGITSHSFIQLLIDD